MKTRLLLIVLCTAIAHQVLAKAPNPLCKGVSGPDFTEGDGSKQNPYLVCSKAQFIRLYDDAELRRKHFKLGQDIDFHNEEVYPSGVFSGSFDGRDYTLSSITIKTREDNSNKHLGLFSVLQRADIHHLMINKLTMANWPLWNGGSLAGESSYSKINSVHVKSLNAFAPDYTGGLIGKALATTLYNVSVEGKMQLHFGSDSVGGIIGHCAHCNIELTSSNIVIDTLDNNQSGISAIGGICGSLDYSRLKDVYTKGSIHLVRDLDFGPNKVGGLIGSSYQSEIVNAYAAVKLDLLVRAMGGAIGSDYGSLADNLFYDKDVAEYEKVH